jgi:hypothetical protein
MTESFPNGERDAALAQPTAEQHLDHEEYVGAAEVMQTLGDALCNHPNVQELDRLRLVVPTPLGGQAAIDSYWMYMTRRGATSFNAQLHRDLLDDGDGLICVSFSRGAAEFSYNVAKPNALSPGTATKHFAVLLDRSFGEVGDAVAKLTREHWLKDELPVTPAELCEHFGRTDIALTLDEPQVFVWNTVPGKKVETLLPTPEHAIHHENLRDLMQSVRISSTE